MNTQKLPLALDLAGAADEVSLWATAKELRRLHEANQVMLEALHWIDKRCPTHFANEALHGMHREMAHDAGACARAAIAKGEQQ
jgi:hypothetical protein